MKSHKIFESNGIVDNEKLQWKTICKIITEYIYDLNDGLNTKDRDTMFTIDDVRLYADKKHLSYTIPMWLRAFCIWLVDLDKSVGGAYLPGDTIYDEQINKVFINIDLNEHVTKDEAYDILIHEFRHAYDHYIHLSKNINKSSNRLDLYKWSAEGFKESENNINWYKFCNDEYLALNDKIFDDPKNLANCLLKSFYYIDYREQNAFLEMFYSDIIKIINDNKDTLISEIKKIRSFKGDFNSLPSIEKLDYTLLSNIKITPYYSSIFRQYKALQLFADQLKNMDTDIVADAIPRIEPAIKLFLNMSDKKTFSYFDYEIKIILKKISDKEKKSFDNLINKMERAFARAISDFEMNNVI